MSRIVVKLSFFPKNNASLPSDTEKQEKSFLIQRQILNLVVPSTSEEQNIFPLSRLEQRHILCSQSYSEYE
jgi:hypothetical protein